MRHTRLDRLQESERNTRSRRCRVVHGLRFLKCDLAEQILHFEFKFEEHDGEGQGLRESVVPMVMRYVERFEFQLLMKRAGFEVADVFADFQKTPYSGKGEMIMVGRKPR